MLVLPSDLDTIIVTLAASVATNQLPCVTSWRDITSTPTYTPGSTAVNTNGTTEVAIVPSPSGAQRVIDFISVHNNDTATATVTITYGLGLSNFKLIKQQLAPGETLVYTSESGFFVIGTPAGEEFTTSEKAKLASLQDWTYVTLAAAAVNSAASDIVTGLSFTPVANTRYEIEGRFFLQAAAATTGVRWGLNWPAGLDQNAAWGISPSSSTAFVSRFWGNTTAAQLAATGVPVANNDIYGQLQALMVTGATPGGQFAVTLRSEIAASEVRIMENSFIRYRTF